MVRIIFYERLFIQVMLLIILSNGYFVEDTNPNLEMFVQCSERICLANIKLYQIVIIFCIGELIYFFEIYLKIKFVSI